MIEILIICAMAFGIITAWHKAMKPADHFKQARRRALRGAYPKDRRLKL